MQKLIMKLLVIKSGIIAAPGMKSARTDPKETP
jgi:hypothetical protein